MSKILKDARCRMERRRRRAGVVITRRRESHRQRELDRTSKEGGATFPPRPPDTPALWSARRAQVCVARRGTSPNLCWQPTSAFTAWGMQLYPPCSRRWRKGSGCRLLMWKQRSWCWSSPPHVFINSPEINVLRGKTAEGVTWRPGQKPKSTLSSSKLHGANSIRKIYSFESNLTIHNFE